MNRLAVVAVQEEENQLLCVTKTEDSTGKVEADAVKEAINNWGLSEGIIACCFDTTSSNTGINSGSCVLLQFLDDRLLSDNLQHLTRARGDYKQLLELAKVCLGGTIERKKTYSYQLSRPGADHHSRWMSKCLYILKLSFLQHQINTISPQTKKVRRRSTFNTMASFILFVYIKFWFSSPSLTRAATNDIQLYKQIKTFKRVDKNVSAAALVVLQRHTWYLTGTAFLLHYSTQT